MTVLLTEAEATTLAEARTILNAVNRRASTVAEESGDLNAEHNGGYVAAKCDAAKDAVTSALIAMKVYGRSDEAARAL